MKHREKKGHTMDIYPAIDLYGGKAVRLNKGDYASATIYNDDPVSQALDFKSQGAKYLHAVDLDGARYGRPENLQIIKNIIMRSRLKTEIGGGIRDIESAVMYLDAGAERVILGTAAVRNPELISELAYVYGSERVAVGVDIRGGNVLVEGWTEDSGIHYLDFMDMLIDKGAGTVICTDISKDGTLSGTNLELYKDLVSRFGGRIKITASGGITTVEDVAALRDIGVDAAILGRAVYTGDIDLRKALEVAKNGNKKNNTVS